MEIEIVWTERAIHSYNKIIKYLLENWNETVADDFVIVLKEQLHLLSQGNLHFKKSKKKKLFEALITKHNLLVYRERKNKIELLYFFDTRQHPIKKR
ncbi:MAG: type II toxin-antitoxin system RelE/ParE family toxin [Bacteroidetes bacterium]|nr:type II toxin-antitoxin system RelE/ParE family toxin [Bacteroidota bacterium]